MSKDKEKGEKLETNTNKEEVKKIKVNDDAKGSEEKENVIKNDRKLILPIAIISILILVLIFSVIFALININNEKIFDNISIMGIDVSNMTREEANKAVKDVINAKISEELFLKKDDYETSLNANQINAVFDVENAVNQAYNIGRDGNIVTNNYGILWVTLFGKDIDCSLNYDEETLIEKIADISSKLPGAVVQSSYYIEDEELIIVKGKAGLTIKTDELKEQILNELKQINKIYEIITIPTEQVQPEANDVE